MMSSRYHSNSIVSAPSGRISLTEYYDYKPIKGDLFHSDSQWPPSRSGEGLYRALHPWFSCHCSEPRVIGRHWLDARWASLSMAGPPTFFRHWEPRTVYIQFGKILLKDLLKNLNLFRTKTFNVSKTTLLVIIPPPQQTIHQENSYY